MKTSEYLAKIVSTGMVLVLCFAIGLFALLLGDRTASAHAYVSLHPMWSATSSPSSGPVGATISVSGSGLTPSGASVLLGYDTHSDCSAFNAADTSNSNPTVQSDGSFSGWFVWPSSASKVNTVYTVCFKIGSSSTPLDADTFTVLSSSAPSVSVDHSSYKVGDNITVTGSNFYPSGTKVTIKLDVPGGGNASNLGNPVTTDSNGSFTQVYEAPSNPTGTLVIVATGGSGSPPPLQATSSQFTIKKKAAATPTPKPTPTPILPPPVIVTTPTPIPASANTPTAMPTNTLTPAPSPTVALAPTPVPIVTPTTSPSGNLPAGRLLLILAIGLGTLLALGILFVVGRLVLRNYLSPAPLPKMPPSGALPWSRSREESLHGNTIMNDVPFAQTMPHKTPFPPGSGGYPPGPGNTPQPQQAPFYGPVGPGNTPQQQVPFNGPFGPGNSGVAPGPGNSGVAPANVAQEPFPPNDQFGPPNQR